MYWLVMFLYSLGLTWAQQWVFHQFGVHVSFWVTWVALAILRLNGVKVERRD